MTDALEIKPSGPASGSIRPPGSKSITNRALVCAALARGESILAGALDCDDTRLMVQGLRQLGLSLDHDLEEQTIRVAGCAGRPPAAGAEIMVGNSGTTARFLTALVTLGQGTFRLDGTPRMRNARWKICWPHCGNSGPTQRASRAAAARRSLCGRRACAAVGPWWPATSPASS